MFLNWLRKRIDGDRPDPVPIHRQTGRTTRLADKYIQELFSTGAIRIRDHTDQEVCHSRLARIVHDRLNREHAHITKHLNIRRKTEIAFDQRFLDLKCRECGETVHDHYDPCCSYECWTDRYEGFK